MNDTASTTSRRARDVGDDLRAPTPQARRRRWRRAIAIAVGLAALGFVLASLWAAAQWIGPQRRSVMPPVLPADARLEEVRISTHDGVTLAGWIATPSRRRGTVLLFHGRSATRDAWRLLQLVERGWRVVAVDFRAHGESAGERTSAGYHEARDVEAVIEHARALLDPAEPLHAWGTSMGAAALCFAAPHARTLDAIVLESPYARLEDAVDRRLRARLPGFLVPCAALARAIAAWRLGVRERAIAPLDHVADLAPARLLLVTGERDDRAPPEDVRALAERAPWAATFLVPGAGHEDLVRVGGTAYLDRVVRFLDGPRAGR